MFDFWEQILLGGIVLVNQETVRRPYTSDASYGGEIYMRVHVFVYWKLSKELKWESGNVKTIDRKRNV